MGPEGELQVTLRLRDGHVAACDIRSSRPDVARLLLQGRRSAEVKAALPRLFSICGVSQAGAGTLALAAAAGQEPDAAALQALSQAVAAETLRETAHRLLLDGPRVLGETPTAAVLAALRAVRQPKADGAARAAIAGAVFGRPVEAWLADASAAGFAQWLADAATPTARFVAAAAAGPNDHAQAGVALLAGAALAAGASGWAHQAEDDPAFTHAPLWQGAPAETGPLARQPADALLQDLRAAHASRRLLRLAARLRELAFQLDGQTGSLAAGSLRLGENTGLGWVENARGLLIHLVRVESDRAVLYRIVAPTDWNFHPQGALAQALQGMAVSDTAALQRQAALVVDSLDPCVACRVETSHA